MPAAFLTYQVATIGQNNTLTQGPTGTFGSCTLTPPTAGATLVDVVFANVQGQGQSTQVSAVTVWRLDT